MNNTKSCWNNTKSSSNIPEKQHVFIRITSGGAIKATAGVHNNELFIGGWIRGRMRHMPPATTAGKAGRMFLIRIDRMENCSYVKSVSSLYNIWKFLWCILKRELGNVNVDIFFSYNKLTTCHTTLGCKSK